MTQLQTARFSRSDLSGKKTFHSRNQVKWLELYGDLYFKVRDCRHCVHFICKIALFGERSGRLRRSALFDNSVQAIKL
jgi:hypothetical protein